ncbi:SDR family oxidoreductase [Flavobacteriaceae bacterium]|nr:SDR family oxidoreductase [Flavobacteriaceae bacterium]
MKIDFKTQVVLITGGTRGIGKQIADDFVNLGANVILTGTNAKNIKQLNEEAIYKGEKKKYFCVDFLSDQSVTNFLSKLETMPVIDVVVNNAGINENNSINKTNLKDWEEIVEVNLSTPFKIIRLVSKKMISNKYGKIINIGSVFSKVSMEKRSIYSATKFGLHGLTMGVSNDLARYNVMVNTLSPGFVMTDLTMKNLNLEERDKLSQIIPAKRLAQTDEISKTVLFLASKQNTYLTGQNIIIDGGFTNV